jgi:catechol 2,3-dioxygenase-like lactoylglutathione lyase family enzyme
MLKLTHSSLFVHDQEEALKFYRDVLGMEVRADFTNGNFRWLSVGSTSQPDLEIVLMATTENHALSADSAKAAQALLNSGQMSGGVFQTDDAMRDYEAWSAKGVEFTMKPTEQYGKIAGNFKDPSGNSFTLQQIK